LIITKIKKNVTIGFIGTKIDLTQIASQMSICKSINKLTVFSMTIILGRPDEGNVSRGHIQEFIIKIIKNNRSLISINLFGIDIKTKHLDSILKHIENN
jgi:hypothetical protein